MSDHRLPERDRPWVMRTYAGHSDARRSNELYRSNLAKGQTGLSVAFDLPTQTGYDPDHVLSRGEVGKVGVSVAHLGDMETLMDQIPLGTMNTSMTINAVAAWMLGLYVAAAEKTGVDRSELKGTTQNDIIKEYLSRGTYAFPPEPSMRLIADMVAFTVNEVPSWNPINICSYHLQEAGATPIQEIAFAISTAIAVLDEVKARGQVADEDFPKVFGRISFFVNAGIRFIEEIAKLKTMVRIWTEIGRERYGVTDEKMLRFRYGVQVNSLGLTEAQPENNVQRIVIEALAVTLSRDARARALVEDHVPALAAAPGLAGKRGGAPRDSVPFIDAVAAPGEREQFGGCASGAIGIKGNEVDGVVRTRRRARRGQDRADGADGAHLRAPIAVLRVCHRHPGGPQRSRALRGRGVGAGGQQCRRGRGVHRLPCDARRRRGRGAPFPLRGCRGAASAVRQSRRCRRCRRSRRSICRPPR